MKESLFQINKKMRASAAYWLRRLLRLFMPLELSLEESFDVPIIINNRNRYTYLRTMVNWFKNAGYRNIIILDNASTYEPVLAYYKTLPAKIVFLKQNVGYKALWQSDVFKSIKNKYYVYTDADLMPISNCPNDVVYQLYVVLRKYKKIEKCGPALKIDDLPNQYERKADVLKVETAYWQNAVEPNVYDAPVDTTFALYKPLAFGDAEQCKAYRLAGNCVFKHMPWYEDSKNPDEETQFYMNNSSNSSFWYRKQ